MTGTTARSKKGELNVKELAVFGVSIRRGTAEFV